jgi:hypothetical protein
MWRQGDRDPHIAYVKRKLGIFPVDQEFDSSLAQRLRGIQLVYRIPVTGVLDEETSQAAGLVMKERSWI